MRAIRPIREQETHRRYLWSTASFSRAQSCSQYQSLSRAPIFTGVTGRRIPNLSGRVYLMVDWTQSAYTSKSAGEYWVGCRLQQGIRGQRQERALGILGMLSSGRET